MPWQIALTAGMGTVFGLFLTGAPIFLCFLIAVLAGLLIVIGPAGFGMFASSLYETTANMSLTSLPLFILMGEILFRSGSIDVMLDAADKMVGRIRGRQLAVINILGAVFGALAGASAGVAAMLGRAAMPTMVARGYDAKLTAGTILAGAQLAPIIPPSLLAIIIGMLADVSIGDLLVSGTLPGLLLVLMFQGYISVLLRFKPHLAPPLAREAGQGIVLREWLWAWVRMAPFLILLTVLMGVIIVGIATPSEAAAISVVGAMVTAAIYRQLNWRMLWESLVATVQITVVLLAIMMTCKLFTQILAFTGSTVAVVKLVTSLDVGYYGMLFIMMAIPFVLCMFIDGIAVMLVVIPIFKPILTAFGYDPLWFWCLFMINLSLGGMTPPFGYSMFALKAVLPDMNMKDIYAACWPFVGVYVVAIAIFVIWPDIITWLPRAFK